MTRLRTIDPATTREELLAGVASVAARIAETEGTLADLLDERAVLFTAGRDMDPPITNQALADAAGVSDVAVLTAVRKRRARTAAATGS